MSRRVLVLDAAGELRGQFEDMNTAYMWRHVRPQEPQTAEDLEVWRQRSACRDEDPELFFPVGTTGPAQRQLEEAKAVCRRCLVIRECLNWALDTGQDAGVWGGLDEDERRALRRQLVSAPAPRVAQ